MSGDIHDDISRIAECRHQMHDQLVAERRRQFHEMINSPEFKAARRRQLEELSADLGIPMEELEALLEKVRRAADGEVQ